MASEVVKNDLAGAVDKWLNEALKSGTAHKLAVGSKTGFVTLRSGTSEWIVEVENAAGLVASKLYDLRQAKDGRLQDKSYSANKYYLKLAGVNPATFGPDEKPIQEREYTPRNGGGVTVSGKSEVAKIDAGIANLKERLAKLEVTVKETKDAIKKLEDARPAAVKAEEDAKAAKEAQKKADEEAQAKALEALASKSDDELEAEIKAAAEALALMRKAIAAKRQTVNA